MPADPADLADPAAAPAPDLPPNPAPNQALDLAPDSPTRVVVALGSNLGDRSATLRTAVARLGAVPGVRLVAVSGVWQTAAIGGPQQPDYLNAVLLLDCTLSPRALLAACQQVEVEHHRQREVRWGPRTLDLDVIVFGDLISDQPDLLLPHPRAAGRAFVLAPWNQVDPSAVLPVAAPGGSTRRAVVRRVAELLAETADAGDVRCRPDLDLASVQ